MTAQLAKLSRNHDLAKAINYMLRRWDAFTCIPRQRPWQRIEVVSQGAFGLCRSDRGTNLWTPPAQGSVSMLLRHWMRESIRPVDRGRLAPGHDGNPLVSVPFKMSGLEGHRSFQAVKRRSVPLHHQVFHLAFEPLIRLRPAAKRSGHFVAFAASQHRPGHASSLVRHGDECLVVTCPRLQFLRPF